MQGGVGAILLLTAVGSAITLILYLHPSPMAIPDHTLLRSWEIDFNSLGFSPDELLERYRFGAVWSSLATVIYMVIVLGGCFLATIYRLDVTDPDESVDDPEPTPAIAAIKETPSERDPARQKLSAMVLARRSLRKPSSAFSKFSLRKH